MTFSSLYKSNRLFFTGILIVVIVSSFILSFYSKAEGFYILNPYHSPILDQFFIYFTNFGDGLFCVAIGLLLFIFKRKFLSLMVLTSYAISGIIAQVLKYFILEARPAVYLKDTAYPYFIEKVTLHNYHAFPSGHSASAFALAATLGFAIKNKNYSILLLIGAILVGYSRIYLGLHFIDDVLAGTVIGFLTAVLCWIFFYKIFFRWVGLRKIN